MHRKYKCQVQATEVTSETTNEVIEITRRKRVNRENYNSFIRDNKTKTKETDQKKIKMKREVRKEKRVWGLKASFVNKRQRRVESQNPVWTWSVARIVN